MKNHDYDFAMAKCLFFVASDFMAAAFGFVEPVGLPGVPFAGLPAGFCNSFRKFVLLAKMELHLLQEYFHPSRCK